MKNVFVLHVSNVRIKKTSERTDLVNTLVAASRIPETRNQFLVDFIAL